MKHRSRAKWNRGSLMVLAASALVLFVLLRIKDGMSHWLFLVIGATYAALALWEYLDRQKPRALVISYSLWSVWALAQFYGDFFPKHSPVAGVLVWLGLVAAMVGGVFMFIGGPELYNK